MVQMQRNRTISEQIAEYVTTMAMKDLPPEVVEKTKQCILDTLGCMLAGSRDRAGVTITAHALRYGAPGPCTVFGRPGGVGPEHAALANGTSAHVLELDDGHRPSDNHIGGVVVSAALAMAQATGAPGTELLLSVTLGYDVMGRVGEAVLLPRIRVPFHGTGSCGVFGSAAAAGRLLGLNIGQLMNAFGVAGDGATGLKEFQTPPFSGMDTKPLHAGRAAQSGVTAALLAAGGFEGPATIFEGPKGFCKVMSPQPRPELICAELGHRFAVIESGFKIHACPGGALAIAVDAALWLRKEHHLDPSSIQQIKLGLPSWTKDTGFERLRHYHPTTVGTARFSYPFIVAVALHDGKVTHHQLTQAKLADPAIARLQDIIEFVTDPEVEEISDKLTREDPYYFAPASLEVKSEGRTYRRLERTPLGYDPKRGLTREQVVGKFRNMVEGVLSETQVDRVADWVFGLDRGSKVSDLSGMLA